MQTILHARDHVAIVLNRLSVQGDPQIPSRLLLALPPEQLGARVDWLLDSKEPENLPSVQSRWPVRQGQSEIPIPLPDPNLGVSAMAVTDFKLYQECPYRFYLARVCRLKPMDDDRLELRADGFGNLIHDVVDGLKGSPVATSIDADQVAKWLLARLDNVARKRFGVVRSPALMIQIEQARARLKAFAILQAKRAAEGWDIIETEVKIPIEAGIRIGSMPLHGRIDRIDFHESSGRWAILDYKTSDMVADPKRHFDTDLGPVDFQLPLYRHLVRGLNRPIQGPIELGYIALSKSIGEIKIAMAEFSDEQLAQSDRRAREIADLVERRVFWPPKMNDLKVWDNFQAICQNSVAKRWVPPPDGLPQSLVSSELPKSTQSEAGPSRKARPSAPHFDPEHPLFRGSCRVPRQNRKVDDRPVRLALKPLKAAGTPPDDWFNPLLIRASAGTGKTFQLANRMLRLLFADQPPDHVLATTFTRKAAGEILERVLLRLAKATIDDQWLTQLQRELQPLKIQREHCQYQLARLCANLHRFRVSTLDSFYSQLAKSFSLELQLPPGWRLADPYAETQLRDLAIQRLFEAQDHDQLKTLLSMLFKGELDRSIQSQIREVVKNGYGLFRVTQAEAWTPIAAPKSPSSADVDRAFQELQAVPVENQKWKGAVQTLGRLIAAQDWEAILKQTLVQAIVPDDETQVPTYNRVQLTWPAIQSVNTIAQAAMSRELGLRREQSEATYQLLAAYDQQLNLVKRSTRTLTFDDIAFRLSQWFQATQSRDSSGDPPVALNVSPKGRQTQLARVSWRMDSRVDHLLLDEFQDTSPVQWEIVKPFAEAIAREGLRRDRSFFCVGDTKQAIYGWRGGVAEIFESVGSQLPHVQDRPLVTSYRSSPVITEFVNEVFRNLDRHPSKQYGIGHAVADAWQRDFPEHQTARSESGYVQFCNGPEKKRANRNEEEIEDSDETLLGWMAEEIESLARRAPHISIGVLARTNKDVANLIGFLRDRQLDASQEGGNPLTDSAAVELVLSLFHMADHPGDSVCAFHVQHSPLAHVLGMDAGRTGDTIAESIRTQVHLQGYGLAVSSFVNRLAPFCNQRDQIRLEQLISVAFRFEELREKRIRDFVRFVREQRLTLPNPSQIRVMTIHQSKGLEFDAVFLSVDQAIMGPPPTLVARQESPTSNPTGVLRYINKDIQRFLDQEWQDVFRSQAQRQLSESLSVFYVAMTRARRGLYLYGVPQKNPVMRWGSALHSILRVSEEQRVMTKCQLVSRGDPLWYQPASSPEQPPNHPEATQRLPESIQSSDEKEAPAAQTISIQLASVDPLHVSRLRPTRRPSSADQPRIVPLRNALADNESMGAIVGTLIHRWFEEIQWIEDFEFQPAAMRELALATLTPDQMPHVSLDYWLEQMEQLLQLDSVRLALARQRYAEWSSQGITRIEVHNERRLLEIMDGTLLRGTIDRLVVGYCGHRPARAEIMDFKTDARNPSLDLTAWELDRAEHHRPQLELYRRIICQQLYLPSECVQLSLLLLSGDRLVSIACEDLNPMNAVNS
jgi:ATP-dependent exoDNAse (exonuclease V) beta subunit